MDSVKTLSQLNKVMTSCQKAPFYQGQLTGAELQSIADFQRLPLTEPEDIFSHAHLGMLCAPWAVVSQYYESFTSSQTSVPVWLTTEDFQLNVDSLSRSGVNFQSDDIVLVRFPYSISEFAHTLTAAAQLAGACVIPADAHSKVSPFPRVIDLLRKLKVTILAGLPLQVLLLAETAELMGFELKQDFPDLRAIVTAGESLSPGRRQTIENTWGVPVFDHYGPDGIGITAISCRHQQLHPLENSFYLEILREDRQTPVEAGEIGYLVVTTLKRQAMPLLRYLTNDLARLTQKPCPCGAPAVLEFRGRAKNRVKLDEITLDLWDMEELVSRLPGCRFWIASPGIQAAPTFQADPNFQAGFDRQTVPCCGDLPSPVGFQATRGLEIIVETQQTSPIVTPEILADACKSIEADFGIRLTLKFVPVGTLYDREALLSIGVVGKPQYIYSAPEMAGQKYLHSARV